MAEGIPYSQGLVQSLEKSLRSAFNASLTLTRKPTKAGNKFLVSLRDGDKTAPDEESGYWLRRILIASDQPSSSFYFGFAATFEMLVHDYTLRHSSLTVFHDILELTPLFRAEWDPRAARDMQSEHAQPHWHFAQRPEHIESIVRTMISEPTDFSPRETSQLFAGIADCGKFHFAMSQHWDQDKKTVYKQVFESDEFPKWFESLTKYIAAQIAYLIRKAPTPPRNFTPEA